MDAEAAVRAHAGVRASGDDTGRSAERVEYGRRKAEKFFELLRLESNIDFESYDGDGDGAPAAARQAGAGHRRQRVAAGNTLSPAD